ncbi:EF-hand domain-containing protein 1-like [Arctopsyche grandis]|uniref:EF-hand domain-containing protein 1-like n=1 Tax=Arctopsyche grandis TaxID=121162 RepID=UPI00406D8E5F
MSWGLPKLPGFSFEDVTKTNFHVPRKIDYVNGYPIVRCDGRAVGGSSMDADGSNYIDVSDALNFDPSLMYGRTKDDSIPIPKPHWVRFDKKFLTFKGHFVQEFPELTIRKIILIYYLEDDTITVVEPHIHNSGLMQGKLVKRSRLPKNDCGQFWHWKDFNVGMDFTVHGYAIHVSSCDEFTREFMTSQGVEVFDDEITDDVQPVRDYRRVEPNKINRKLSKHFLDDDGRVLQFDAIWDDSNVEHGEVRNYKILYSINDKTVSIKECHVKNGGRDPFPMLLRKTRIFKNWSERSVNSPIFGQERQSEDEEYYGEDDLLIGETINILGRDFLLCDCDDFTRRYYKNVLNIDQREPIRPVQPEKKILPMTVGPHIGIGDPDDTFMSCLSFHLKPPHKDVVQYNLYGNKNLRYLCEMISVHPEDAGRRFVLSYHLADGLIRIDELLADNSGLSGGRFSGPSKLPVPGCGFGTHYTPEMFYIGAIIIVKNHKLRIVSADLFVYNYMMENRDKFPSEIVENLRQYHLQCGNLKSESAQIVSGDIASMDGLLKETQDFRTDNWRPTELAAPLQAMESAQILPDSEASKVEDQPVVCLTGPATVAHTVQDQIDVSQQMDRNNVEEIPEDDMPNLTVTKRVSFKNVPENHDE